MQKRSNVQDNSDFTKQSLISIPSSARSFRKRFREAIDFFTRFHGLEKFPHKFPLNGFWTFRRFKMAAEKMTKF